MLITRDLGSMTSLSALKGLIGSLDLVVTSYQRIWWK